MSFLAASGAATFLLNGCSDSSGEDTPITSATSFDAATQANLNAALDRIFPTLRASGLIAAVSVGSRSWSATRGTTATGGQTAVTTDLFTRIGSVTKTLTGTVILQLVDDGLLSLDDPLSKWFPEIEGSALITIRHLGTIASGFDSYTLDDATTQEYFNDPTHSWDPLDLLHIGAALPRKFAAGDGFLYCNTNLVALGLIAERVLQSDMATILQQKIFTPLGMAGSSYPYGTDLPDPHWTGYTTQNSPDDTPTDATYWSPTFAAAAGEGVSNLADLLVWTRALGTGSLLSAAAQAARLVPNPNSVSGVRSYLFALGNDNGWLAHSGELPGYNTQIAYLPSLDASIVVLVNSDIAGTDGLNPAPKVFTAFATILAPDNIP